MPAHIRHEDQLPEVDVDHHSSPSCIGSHSLAPTDLPHCRTVPSRHRPLRSECKPMPSYWPTLWPMPSAVADLVTPSVLTADLAEPQSTIPLTAAPHGISVSTAAIRVPTGAITLEEHAGSYRFPGPSHHAFSASAAATRVHADAPIDETELAVVFSMHQKLH